MKKPLLELKNLTMTFGGLTAVNDLSFAVYPGEIVGLIGPNGAGKTTVFNCVTQFYKDYQGTITFGRDQKINLVDVPVTEVIDQGLVRTFQNIELIPDMSVIDNLLIGAHRQFQSSLWGELFRTKKARQEEARLREKALAILTLLNIDHLQDYFVKGQPYGILKKIEIARTLMSNPAMIVLDEPAAGLNDKETDELETLILEIRKQYDVTILLIEHDMGFVMKLCDRVCAINFGKFLAMEPPAKIQKNPLVQEAYLGKED